MSGRINEVPIDRFTTLHVASGSVLRVMGLPWWGALLASVLFEIAENAIQPSVASVFPDTAPQDSLINSFFDTPALMGGWASVDVLARRHAK